MSCVKSRTCNQNCLASAEVPAGLFSLCDCFAQWHDDWAYPIGLSVFHPIIRPCDFIDIAIDIGLSNRSALYFVCGLNTEAASCSWEGISTNQTIGKSLPEQDMRLSLCGCICYAYHEVDDANWARSLHPEVLLHIAVRAIFREGSYCENGV